MFLCVPRYGTLGKPSCTQGENPTTFHYGDSIMRKRIHQDQEVEPFQHMRVYTTKRERPSTYLFMG